MAAQGRAEGERSKGRERKRKEEKGRERKRKEEKGRDVPGR